MKGVGIGWINRGKNIMVLDGGRYEMVVRPKSHLLYGEDTVAVRPLN